MYGAPVLASWPEGYHCPKCGHCSYRFHSTRRLYQCSECKHQVSVTADRIFCQTRPPLVSWSRMIFMTARRRSGLSMLSCQRMLGIKTYKTVWTMGQKIGEAMTARDSQYQLAGPVEWTMRSSAEKTGRSGWRCQGESQCSDCRRNAGQKRVTWREAACSGRWQRPDPFRCSRENPSGQRRTDRRMACMPDVEIKRACS